jgi:hypothetical protein
VDTSFMFPRCQHLSPEFLFLSRRFANGPLDWEESSSSPAKRTALGLKSRASPRLKAD